MNDQERHAAHIAMMQRRRPEHFQPWENVRPSGYRLADAILELVFPEFRGTVADLLADEEVGFYGRSSGFRAYLWLHVWWRLQQGNLVAFGRIDGPSMAKPITIDRDVLDNATPDFRANTLTCGSTVFGSIRIYQVESAPKENDGAVATTAPSKSSVAPEPRHGDEFIQEMLRLALTPDGFETHRQLQEHMKAWCSRTMGDDIPSARSIERWVKRYCPPELPTK